MGRIPEQTLIERLPELTKAREDELLESKLGRELLKITEVYSAKLLAAQLSQEKRREVLQTVIDELIGRDMLVSLLTGLARGEIEGEKVVVAYEHRIPSLKSLNDDYLGPQATDAFIEDLQKQAFSTFGAKGTKLLHNYFKGGILMMPSPPGENATEREVAAYEEIRKKASMLQFRVQAILIGHLHNALQKDQPEKRRQNIEKLFYELVEGEANALITIGYSQFPAMNSNPTNKELVTAFSNIRKSQFAQKMATLRIEKDQNPEGERDYTRSTAQQYNLNNLLADVFRFNQRIAVMVSEKDEENIGYKIRERWEGLFRLRKGVEVYPERAVIRAHSKGELQDLLSKKGYLPAEINLIQGYLDSIGILDVLKSFETGNIDHYLSRIRTITALLLPLQEKIDREEEFSVEEFQTALESLLKEAEVSMKDEGGNQMKTWYAVVKNLMQGHDGERGLLMVDWQGFKVGHTLGLIQKSHEIKNAIFREEGMGMDIYEAEDPLCRSELAKIMEKRDMQGNRDIKKILLGIDDIGNGILNRARRKLYAMIYKVLNPRGEITFNAVGGDEADALIDLNEEHSEQTSLESGIDSQLMVLSRDNDVRIAFAISENLILNPEEFTVEDIGRQNRSNMANVIDFKEKSEEIYERLKDREKKGAVSSTAIIKRKRKKVA